MEMSSMSYDVLRDADLDDETVHSIVEAHGLTKYCTGEEPPIQVQAEILEALNQFGSQTMDDTVKRNGMWALVRALGIIEATHNLNTTFTRPTSDPQPSQLTELITTNSGDITTQSIISKRH